MVPNVEGAILSQVNDGKTVVPVVDRKPPRFEVAQTTGYPTSNDTVVDRTVNLCLRLVPVPHDGVGKCFPKDADCNVDTGSTSNLVTVEDVQLAKANRNRLGDKSNTLLQRCSENALQTYFIENSKFRRAPHNVVLISVFMVPKLIGNTRPWSCSRNTGNDIFNETQLVSQRRSIEIFPVR